MDNLEAYEKLIYSMDREVTEAIDEYLDRGNKNEFFQVLEYLNKEDFSEQVSEALRIRQAVAIEELFGSLK